MMGIVHTRNQCKQYRKGTTQVSVPEMGIGLGQTRRAFESYAHFSKDNPNPDGLNLLKNTTIARYVVPYMCDIVTYDIDLHFAILVDFALSSTYSHLCCCNRICDIG